MRRSFWSAKEILAPGDLALLMSQGLAGPLEPTGTRKVHRRRLNRSSDEENRNIPLNVNPQSDPDTFATIPDQLFSQATIEYVGFDEQTAAEIWNGWNNWPAGPGREIDPDDGGLQVSFLDWVKGHAGYSDDVWEDDDATWWSCMQQRGIATELRQAIMDPHFKYTRLTGTCVGWLRDTIKMRYAGLEDIQRASFERDRANQRSASRSRGSDPSQGARSISDLQRDVIPGMMVHSCDSTKAIASQSAPGMTVLFKGMDSVRTTWLLDDQGRLNDIAVLESTPPTDFSRNKSMYYFTTSFEVAKRYAAWAKRRANCGSAVVIRIAVRNSVIEGLSEGNLLLRIHWPNPEWKELIWRCRTRTPASKELRKYGAAILIIGTMANKSNEHYYQYEAGNQLPASCVLEADGGQQGIQFAFSTEPEGEVLLKEEAARTVEIFYFTSDELV